MTAEITNLTLEEFYRRMNRPAQMCRAVADDIEATFIIFGRDPTMEDYVKRLRKKADELDGRV